MIMQESYLKQTKYFNKNEGVKTLFNLLLKLKR